MKIRHLIAASAIALLATSGAFAATKPADQCTALEKQFDKDFAANANASAKSMRADAEKLCKSGKASEGVKKLQDAIKASGGTPAS